MTDKIKIFPYSETPRGITVLFRRNGGKGILERMVFPAGTKAEAIKAALAGKPVEQPDPNAEKAKKDAAEKAVKTAKAARAKKAQAPKTKTESQIQKQDEAKADKVKSVAAMKKALIAAKVQGANMMAADQVKTEYEKLIAKNNTGNGGGE